jgi:hypothetical protein
LKYSGKQKTHTDKALILYSTNKNLILAVYTDVGTVHDIKMLKDSRLWSKAPIQKANSVLDSGFQGIDDWLPNSITPFKKSRKSANNPNPQLTKEQRWFNKTLAQERIKIENINREIKKFRICKEIRRQKQRKHDLFWKVVSGIVNFKSGF